MEAPAPKTAPPREDELSVALADLAADLRQVEDLDQRLAELVDRTSWDATDAGIIRSKSLRALAGRPFPLADASLLPQLVRAAFPEDGVDLWAALILDGERDERRREWSSWDCASKPGRG